MQLKKQTHTYFATLIFFSVVYFLTARLGLLLATINYSVSPVWPATGLAFGILFIYGYRYWPAIALGAFSANILNPGALASALSITVGNTLQALIGTWILHYFFQRNEKFGSHTRTLGIVVASFVGSCLSATVGTTALSLAGIVNWDLYRLVWFTWCTGDFLGGITILPLILAFFSNQYDVTKKINVKFTSAMALILSGIFLCWIVFIRLEGAVFIFFLFPYLLWCVGVSGEQGVAISTVLISLFGIIAVQLGHGVFIHGSANINLINLQLFLGSMGISSLIMSDLKRISSLRRPAIILLFSWFVAGLFFFSFYTRSINETNKHFEVIIDGVEPMLNAKMNLYFSALRNSTGLFAASDQVTRLEWHKYFDYGDSINQLPGVEGLGVAFRVLKKNFPAYIKSNKADKSIFFNYHLVPNLSPEDQQKTKDSSEAFIVTYIEPYEKNITQMGLDLYSESKRRMAAEIARDTGKSTISSNIVLTDDPKNRSAFIIFHPIYVKGADPKTINERRSRLLGWVYTPVFSKDFFDSLFALNYFKELSVSVSEKNAEGAIITITSSKDYNHLPKSDVHIKTVNVGNHNYILSFKRSASFFSGQDNFSSWAGVTSSMISLFLGTFIVSLQTVKKKAVDLAMKKTEDLRASEELLKFALEGSGDGVWDLDIPNNTVHTSRRFKEILGYADNELSNDRDELTKFVHPEDLPVLEAGLKNISNDSSNYIGDFRVRCKDGTYKWILDRGMVVGRDQYDMPLRMVGTISDISARKETERELEGQKAKLQSIFEGTSDSILLLNRNGNIFDCNTQALKLFGLKSKEELMAINPAELFATMQADGSNLFTKTIENINKGHDIGINQFEWPCKRKDGKEFPVEVLFTAFTYDGNKVLQARLRDISERKNIEESLNIQREKLMASAKMSSLGEMAGGIAHEINNPLAIIVGKITQLKRRLKVDADVIKLNEDLSVIENTAKRIGSIIKGLSAFSRNAENDSMEKILVPLLIQDTLELSRERFKFNSIDLRFDFANCQQAYVKGRVAQLLQVLVNLLNNAFDAVEELPIKWVDIQVEVVANSCKLMITDSGEGIHPEIVEKIMSPFFTTKSVARGTGLGLSISKGIIEEHHGKLYYDTTSKNTRFVIELPIA
ncbi:MAG: PAS domain S-box protein [Bacteriovorax sp.]|nr:PAS domain S-box protein [Bacteriovorax sp.]